VLLNGSFEKPPISPGGFDIVDDSVVTGWTSSSGLIEVWHRDNAGVGSADGSNLIELNVNQPTTIRQDFVTTPGSTITWAFSHRGRTDTDSVEFRLGPRGGQLAVIKVATTGLGWTKYSGSYEVPDGQRITRVEFRALDSGSVGNFLDGVEIAVDR
jgi:hypothetical protein